MFKLLIITLASLFSVSSGAYIQLSSTVTQNNGPLGAGVAMKYDSIDAAEAVPTIQFTSGGSKIKVTVAGAYFIIAAPQVGSSLTSPGLFGRLFGGVPKFTADYYVVVNGVPVPNSNVRLTAAAGSQDVIVTQGVYVLKANDEIEIFGSGDDTFSEFIAAFGSEPAIPSIITTVFSA